ncbi:hypothetical protein R1sor_008040 [Riccia sorocarpa]|uniref:Uncharacterized protein n=1 Tax=Riccia sorocarpa TaxID=122646 RepID=A0ABD3HUI0_9MARC
MLDSIGEVLYKTTDKQTNQYSNITACVLIDLVASLMDFVDVVIYGEVVWSQDKGSKSKEKKTQCGETSTNNTGESEPDLSTRGGSKIEKDRFQQLREDINEENNSISEGKRNLETEDGLKQGGGGSYPDQANIEANMMLKFENEVFSQEQVIVEKWKAVDGKDEAGFRRNRYTQQQCRKDSFKKNGTE